jgi:DNA-binding response OmpR family regulator
LPYVLLVEDNEGASGALRVLFEATGHRVTVAATVSEAVRVIRDTHPDLVLLDLTLPDGDGFDVVQGVDDAGVQRPPFAAVTGHDDPAIVARCKELGMVAVLVKPVPPRELIAKAKGWLTKRD